MDLLAGEDRGNGHEGRLEELHLFDLLNHLTDDVLLRLNEVRLLFHIFDD